MWANCGLTRPERTGRAERRTQAGGQARAAHLKAPDAPLSEHQGFHKAHHLGAGDLAASLIGLYLVLIRRSSFASKEIEYRGCHKFRPVGGVTRPCAN